MQTMFRTGFARPEFRALRMGDDTSGIITSIDQGPAAQPVPGIVTQVPTTQPAGTSDADWAKTISQALTAASQGYGNYTKEDIARMQAQAAMLKAKNPSLMIQTPTQTDYTPIVLGLAAAAAVGAALYMALK